MSRAGWPPSVQRTPTHTTHREERNGRSQARPGQGRHRRRHNRHTRDAGGPRPGRYEIDTSCSAVTFRTRHLFGLAPVRGSFAIRAGTIDVAEPLAGSSVYVQIDPASVRTRNGQRDNNVRSERLLDTLIAVRRFRWDPRPE
jgi:hypothetical protein